MDRAPTMSDGSESSPLSDEGTPQVDPQLLRDRTLIPRGPFEMQATQAILQRHLDNGDITQRDLDLMKKSYKTAAFASFVGSCLSGGIAVLAFRRYNPRAGWGAKFFVAGFGGMLGSFLGFSVGGVAAATEVNREMENSQQKMKIFAQIATESKKTIRDLRMGDLRNMQQMQRGGPTRSSGPGSSGSLDNPTADQPSFGTEVEARDERRREMERERDYPSDARQAGRDSQLPSRMSSGEGVRRDERRESEGAGTAWDRLRTGGGKGREQVEGMGSTPRSSTASVGLGGGLGGIMRGGGGPRQQQDTGGAAAQVDDRTKEQRDFDEMLERERRGVDVEVEGKWR